MGLNFNKMDLDTVVIFGAGSFLAKKIIKRINFKKAICFSKTLNKNFSKNKKILFFKSYLDSQEKINKLLNKKKITVIFFNNTTFDNLILNKTPPLVNPDISRDLIYVEEVINFANSKYELFIAFARILISFFKFGCGRTVQVFFKTFLAFSNLLSLIRS